MFDMGFWELLVMAVIGLLVLGPERLPRAARQLGRWLSAARRTAAQLRWQIEREIDLGEQQQRRPSEQPSSAENDPARGEPTSAASETTDAGPAPHTDTDATTRDPGPADQPPEGASREREG